MTPARVLVAGTGNVLRGDDGFGVEVVAHLAREPWPPGVVIRDCGIRGLHLAFELLDTPGLLVFVDAVDRQEAPGTLFLLEPDGAAAAATPADPHDVGLAGVLATVLALGGQLPRVLIVGCQPQTTTERLGLSAPVRRAVDGAAALVRSLVHRELAGALAPPVPEEVPHEAPQA